MVPIFLRFIIWELRKSRKESFQGTESQWSEIELADNKLVSVGQWDDLDQVFQLVYEMSSFTSDELQHFCKTDQLNATDVSLVQSDILCECMQMKYQVITRCDHTESNYFRCDFKKPYQGLYAAVVILKLKSYWVRRVGRMLKLSMS